MGPPITTSTLVLLVPYALEPRYAETGRASGPRWRARAAWGTLETQEGFEPAPCLPHQSRAHFFFFYTGVGSGALCPALWPYGHGSPCSLERGSRPPFVLAKLSSPYAPRPRIEVRSTGASRTPATRQLLEASPMPPPTMWVQTTQFQQRCNRTADLDRAHLGGLACPPKHRAAPTSANRCFRDQAAAVR